MLWQKNVNERLKTILCVSLSARYPTPPAGVDVILKICWFVLNPKQADLPTPLPPCISAHKQPPPTPSPLLAERMVLRTPHSSTHPVLGMLAELGDCDVAALSGQHLLFWITCQQRGRVSCTVRGLKEGWAGLRGRIPVSAGWSDWMRVTTTAVVFAKSFLKLTMWPVEGQTRQEIEVNDIVTY